MLKFFKLVVLVLFVLFSTTLVYAFNEKSWGDNYYGMVNLSYNLSWTQAVTKANNLYYNGLRGHLVAITTLEESNALTSFLKEWSWEGNRWTGAYQLYNTGTSDIGWKWITGEEFNFTNWQSGEPNDALVGFDSENNMTISTWFSSVVGTWYDAPENPVYVYGYIVEYEKASSSAVPEPATLSLFGLGLIGLVFRRKK